VTDLKQKLLFTAFVAACVFIIYALKIPCIFLSITGVKCPGCGMTRAILSAMSLNFKEAFYYHKMFWSMPLLYWCFLKDGEIFSKKFANFIFYVVILIGFVLNMVL
jgi:hypothetical protein